MSSKQINFYITPQDVIEINNLLIEKGCLIFKGKTEELGSDLDYDIVRNTDNIFQVYICNEEFKQMLFFEQMKSGEYYIDIMKSYVIEFGIGGFYPYSEKELNRSRLYFVYEYYNHDELVAKNVKFVN